MAKIKEVIAELTSIADAPVINRELLQESIRDLQHANMQVEIELEEAKDNKEEEEGIIAELKEENQDLRRRSIRATSIIDDLKLDVLKRLNQNLSIQQLEEVEAYAKTIVKSVYVEFINEN